ncbi:assembly factor CBP4 [Gaeumannomyces tritici R3-111a-1]|uniref:Cytochrome b mRNA-processing protein 4 n=1 Tax=Gaeumannomyces tritici (strain R3-111a-1) TaxID=644352 RepID=J3PDE6_GAET3|nr:assembly factor CBP4 [Gaeumannomyces tritici R3-111a-1]EJT70491.1 assembly factor CBP4 [Gaeumannomyces tritici R3-111a-1]
MAAKQRNWGLWLKMILGGTAMAVGGPMFVMSITPTEEELFKKYNPDLQKRSLETRHERQKEYDDFVTKLKEYSKSDKSIWIVQAEEQQREKEAQAEARRRAQEDGEARKEQMRRELGLRGVSKA